MGGWQHIEVYRFISIIGSTLALMVRRVSTVYCLGGKYLARIREAGVGITGFVLQKPHPNQAKTTLLCKIFWR